MNSQRGKASTKASKNRQVRKSQTNANKNNNNNNKKRNISYKSSSVDASVSFLDTAGVAYSQGQSTQSARIVRTGAMTTRIIHREQIDTVALSTLGFNIDGSFEVNPGLYQTFPWLSGQAGGWEKYRFNRLKFVYYPRCSTATTGSVMLSPDFESSDSPPGSLLAASSNVGAVEDAAWKTITLTMPREYLQADRFVRRGPKASGTDIRLTDIANVYCITSDASAIINAGKLWVEYDVNLMIPNNNPQVFQGYSIWGVSPTMTPSNIFGPTATYYSRDTSLDVLGGTLTLKNLQVGSRYCFNISVIGTGITAWNILSVTGAGLSNSLPSIINGAATNASCGAMYIASSTQVTLTLNYTITTVATCTVQITNGDYYQI